MSKCLWSWWKWLRGIKELASPFSCCSVNRECPWKKTQIEKKKKKGNSIDFYKGIFLHVIPARIIVPCTKLPLWWSPIKTHFRRSFSNISLSFWAIFSDFFYIIFTIRNFWNWTLFSFLYGNKKAAFGRCTISLSSLSFPLLSNSFNNVSEFRYLLLFSSTEPRQSSIVLSLFPELNFDFFLNILFIKVLKSPLCQFYTKLATL